MPIFTEEYLNGYLAEKQDSIRKKIEDYDYRQLKEFDQSDYDDLCTFFKEQDINLDFQNYKILNVEQGDGTVFNQWSTIYRNQSRYINVHGYYVTIAIPVISGANALPFQVDPAFRFFGFSDENYKNMILSDDGNSVTFKLFITATEVSGKSNEEKTKCVKSKYLEYIKGTKENVEASNELIAKYNSSIEQIARASAEEKIKRDSEFEAFKESLSIEVKTKNAAQTKGKKIEIIPKKMDIYLPDRKQYDGYYIDKDNYNAIIETIRLHLVATENLPKAIQKLDDEELIRDTILWALNANYFVATGETFRNQGKSDILINFKDRSAFVAECKLWKGKSYVSKAIDQLFGYTTWRDSKAAIIVFNLEKQNFAEMCQQLREIAKEHKQFKRMKQDEKNECFRCEFNDPNSESSTIEITFLAANYVKR